MAERISEELMELFKEYETLIVLEQHDKLSKLGSKICANLVELLDEDLSDETDNDDKVAKVTKSSVLRDFIENFCNIIFYQGKIAAAYAEVREFVRIRDLVCFSKLVKAIPDKSHEDELIIDLECLSRILRQCIYLLKYINESSSTFEEFEDNNSQHHDLWLDKSYVNNFRSKNHSFPIYHIDNINKTLISLSNDNQISKPTKIVNNLKNLVERLPDNGEEGERLSNRIYSSNWFKEFINNNLSKGYPLSRFTVLVAIWIISVDCNHKVLEQLTGALIDQIYHEEANSNNEEELLQLTQVGSFWLTYHKKYKATLRQVNLNQIYDDNDNEEISNHDNTSESLSSPSSSSSASSNSSVSLVHHHHNHQNLGESLLKKENGKDEVNDRETSLQVDLRFKLRQLINEELLHGMKCIICSYEPTELFEPLNTNSCPKCANQKPVERCSISYRPLELVCFDSLIKFKPNISKLVLVSPNEWARHIIAPKLASLRIGLRMANIEDDQTFSNFKQQQQQQQEQQQVVERVVVAENYERLTVVRGGGGDIYQVGQKVDKKEDNDGYDKDESSSTPLSSPSSSSLSSSSRSSSLVKEENQDSLSDGDEDEDKDEKEEKEEERRDKFDRRRRRRSRRRKKKVTGNQRMDGDTYISILENYIKVRLKHSENKSAGKIGRHTNSSSLSETIEMFKMFVSNNSSNTTILPVCLTDLLIMDTNHDNVDGGRTMFKLALVTSNNKLFESGSLWSCSNRSSISKVRLGCGSVFSSLELVRLGLQSGGGSNEFICPLCYCQPLIRLRKLNEEL